MLPVRVGGPHGITAYAWMPLLALCMFLFVQWWAAWYPGAEPGGGGYVAQRIFAARSERDGVLATLFFQIAHYALRPWPWIVTGLATVILYPTLQDKESGYVHAFVDLLPTPWRGFMMAGFAAAYMSTIGTQLNWGASYLVNDFYKRFLRRERVGATTTCRSRAPRRSCSSWSRSSWRGRSRRSSRPGNLLIALGAGTGLVYMLRWYWWRINAWSEISAMVVSLAVAIVALQVVPHHFAAGDPNADAVVMLVTVGVTTVVWIAVTFLTPPRSTPCSKRSIVGYGPAARAGGTLPMQAGFGAEPLAGGGRAWANWIAGHCRGVCDPVRHRQADLRPAGGGHRHARRGGRCLCLDCPVARGRNPAAFSERGLRPTGTAQPQATADCGRQTRDREPIRLNAG